MVPLEIMALSGKIALVTGAAAGIGRAMTEELLKVGGKVALLDINEAAGKGLVENLEKTFGKERTLFVCCNIQSKEQLNAAFKKTVDTFGGIDILCNNAGILNEKEWEQTVNINLIGMIRVTYTALEHMSKLSGGRGGVIVNTASMAGLGPFPSCPVYTATKHGVVGFTRAMAIASNVSGYGIRINALCPGFVDTELITNIQDKLGPFSHLKEMTQNLVESMGTMNVSRVAESLIEVLMDETKNGQAMLIQPNGKKYVEFQSNI